MALFVEKDSLVTESDVEQKFIYAFLTAPMPIGFGLNDTQILTKHVLRQQLIGKGQKQKYYYPDYLISIRGIPICVIEAKKPDEVLETAFAEARLYSSEINSKFPHGINSCKFIIACNGHETWVGYFDQAEPVIKLTFDDFSTENKKYVEFLDFCSLEKMFNIANQPYINIRGKSQYNTPVSQLKGKRVQNETIQDNSFGRTFIIENRRIFDPQTEEDRSIIVDNAYIPSAKREQHIDPIYKEIRKFAMPNQESYVAIATNEPTELVQKISKRVKEKIESYSLMLLIGNVGSGKTTFIRYFKRKFLDEKEPELAQRCDWIFLNMNSSPINRTEIYEWIKQEIITQIKTNHLEIDFSSIDTIKNIFRKEVNDFENGLGQLLKNNESEYNIKLYDLLSAKMSENTTLLKHMFQYLKEINGALPIIVLDNCDKRNKEEQLLMFQVAEWLKTTFKCLVILPMRDSTYDQYRNEPPLDTVVKDLVFRIDPPDLLKVLQARLNFIVRNTKQEDTTYVLDNGVSVAINYSELIEYFKCILMAIRQNSMTLDIFYRLSDRNTRYGIQIFEDFCKSGHISSSDFLRMRTLGQEYTLPSYKFLNALLRKNRKYYNGEESNFINLFGSNYHDDFPDPFVRIDILKWLQNNSRQIQKHKEELFVVSDIIKEMQLIGHKDTIIHRELNYMIKKGLILSETLLPDADMDDRVKITLTGKLHLSLLSNMTYIAACAENINFRNTDIMIRISRRLATTNYLSKKVVYLNAKDAIEYLIDYRNFFLQGQFSFLKEDNCISIYDVQDAKNSLDKWKREDSELKLWIECYEKYCIGTVIEAEVVKKVYGSVICRFDNCYNLKGFLSVNIEQYGLSEEVYQSLEENNTIQCKVIEYDFQYNSFQLKFLELIN